MVGAGPPGCCQTAVAFLSPFPPTVSHLFQLSKEPTFSFDSRQAVKRVPSKDFPFASAWIRSPNVRLLSSRVCFIQPGHDIIPPFDPFYLKRDRGDLGVIF